MTDDILVAEGLRKSYGDILALRGVSLRVHRGEIFGLLGPNGAGKTTAISIVTGLIPADEGRVVVDGVDLGKHPLTVKGKIGLVPQDLAIYPTLSARENLAFFGRIYGLGGRRLAERVEAVLDVVGLRERATHAAETFSGGMKRRLNMAAGLLHEPALLFLDEPTVGVDPQSRNAIFESVEALNRAGMTVVYTTHYMEEAQRLCHRVGIIDRGELIALDTPRALIETLGEGVLSVAVPDERRDEVARQMTSVSVVKSVQAGDGVLRIKASQSQAALLSLLETCARLDVPIRSLEIYEPNLETVFLYLTGKRLRD